MSDWNDRKKIKAPKWRPQISARGMWLRWAGKRDATRRVARAGGKS